MLAETIILFQVLGSYLKLNLVNVYALSIFSWLMISRPLSILNKNLLTLKKDNKSQKDDNYKE